MIDPKTGRPWMVFCPKEPMVKIPIGMDCRTPEQKAGVIPYDTRHRLGCVMRYGAVPDDAPIDPKDCPCNRKAEQ